MRAHALTSVKGTYLHLTTGQMSVDRHAPPPARSSLRHRCRRSDRATENGRYAGSVLGVRVRLLGSVDVITGGVPQPVSGLRRRALLAVLGLSAGEVVSTDRLIDTVWAGAPPATAVNTLQSHVSYLRGLLGGR